jgi:cytochrome c553
MNKALIVAVALVAAAPVRAQSVAPPGATSCSGCHGNDHNALGVPILHGQTSDAIVAAMQEYRTGRRSATVMDRIAKGFSDEESRAIAAWIAHQP